MATPLQSAETPASMPEPVATPTPADEPVLRAPSSMTGRFAALASICHRFSEEIAHDAVLPFPRGLEGNVKDNLGIAKAIFGRWSLEILVITYLNTALGFQELKYSLGAISSRTLSEKLRQMEGIGLIRREVLDERPPRTLYSLTEEGLMVARLGEPVFLYLRLHGLAKSPPTASLPADP